MAARDNINRDLFHASDLPEEEFMNAPVIHVGTYGQADKMADHITVPTSRQRRDIHDGLMAPEDVYKHKIHSTPLSDHAKIYPVTLTDRQANRVHVRFLSERGIVAPPKVMNTVYSVHAPLDEDKRLNKLIEDRALAAMNRNEVIRYVNDRETPAQSIEDVLAGKPAPDPHSFLVPSPIINLNQMSQRALPMDYSGIRESTVTQHIKNSNYPDVDFARVMSTLKNRKSTIRPHPKQSPTQTKETPHTNSLIDPDVVWPDPQLPDMWKY